MNRKCAWGQKVGGDKGHGTVIIKNKVQTFQVSDLYIIFLCAIQFGTKAITKYI